LTKTEIPGKVSPRVLVVGRFMPKGRRTGNSGENPGRPRRCDRV
jgi:hypothetical protein